MLPARLHLLGVGGAGLSGAARLLQARGHRLTGHDRSPSPFSVGLEGEVAIVYGPSSDAGLPADVEGVVRSAAIDDGDPQLVEAHRRGLPTWKYGELLGQLAPAGRTLGVAGTHGKTTTSWMLWHALSGMHQLAGTPESQPGALVGGLHRELGVNALSSGEVGPFVAEACEYDRTFLQLDPAGAVLTNVEADHLDYYGSVDALERSFARFVDRVDPSGLIVVGEGVPERIVNAARAEVWRLGRELIVELIDERLGCFELRVKGPGWVTPAFRLSTPGAFNVENAALAVGLSVGLAARGRAATGASTLAAAAAREVARFEGAARRFESWGTSGGVELVHDYAHHPTEVSATLEAARRALPGKPLHVLFQPHQESRTSHFLDDFARSLQGAKRVVVADVYGARAHIDGPRAAGAAELVERIRALGIDAEVGGSPEDAARALARGTVGACAGLVLGAGDIDGVQDLLRSELALRGAGAR